MLKKIACLSAVIVLIALSVVSCGGPKALGMYPVYIGEEVTSTNHEFSHEDFYVIVAFDDGTDKEVRDFEFGEIFREAGYYVVTIEYQDVTYPVYVPIHVAVYPSQMGDAE